MAIGIGRALVIVAVISASVGLLATSSAWVFHADDRRPSHSTIVGSLEFDLPEGTARGTAVLVDDCGILTNFHVVFGPWYVTALREPSRDPPGRFTLTEASRPDGTKPTARAIPVVWGDYRGADRHLRAPQHDWAYLVLDPCVGSDHAVLRAFDPMGFESPIDPLAALGYSTGRQMIDPACSVRDVSGASGSPVWVHDCALEAGDSGGPIVIRGTSTMVGLSARMSTDPHDPRCPQGTGVGREPPLAHWNPRCANVAVPLTAEIIARIETARVAAGVQRALIAAGYDAGPLGAVEAPRAIAAIQQVQREMGWPVTGKPTDALRKILRLRLWTS